MATRRHAQFNDVQIASVPLSNSIVN